MASSAEAILIVLDVGPSVGQEISPNKKSFFYNAQHCATTLITKKILSMSKDEIGLILLGSEETNNPLADGDGYGNIEIAHSLELANWQMVHTISSYKTFSPVDGDWLDALIVAVDFMKTSTEGKRFNHKKIVMLTNFRGNFSDDEVNCVIQGIQSEELEIVVIGPHLYTSDSQGEQQHSKSEDQKEGEKLIARIISETNGIICSFEDAIPQLAYFEQKKTRSIPWKAILDIGSKIKIPVLGYKKIADTKRMSFHDVIVQSKQVPCGGISTKLSNSPPHDSLVRDAQQFDDGPDDTENVIGIVDKDRIYQTYGDNAISVDASNIVEGYMFGSTIVAVTDDDKPHLTYQSGPKVLSTLGFTKRLNVPSHILKGIGCMQIFPEKEENCMRAFAALIQAMHSKDVVAIVRRVYCKNANSSVGVLFPHIEPNYQCFVYVELPYSEEVQTLLFPPLVTEKDKPTKEQLQAVDQLITSMDLMKADEDDDGNAVEAYETGKMMDPSEQHFYHVVAKKALDGDSFISGSYIHEAVQQLLTPKEAVTQAAKPALQKIKELFPLTEIVLKEGTRKAATDIFNQNTLNVGLKQDTTNQSPGSSDSKDVKPHIGTLNPQGDFTNLISQGVPLETACCLMESVIIDMISKAFDVDDFNKPYKALIVMRKVCMDINPSVYNDWMVKLKKDLSSGKSEFWQMIVDGHSGLISSLESSKSKISTKEASDFLDAVEMKEELVVPQSLDEDMDDLINQM